MGGVGRKGLKKVKFQPSERISSSLKLEILKARTQETPGREFLWSGNLRGTSLVVQLD